MSKLPPKQQRFVEEYLKDLNAKQAAIRTGYSAKTAEVQASRLLSNAKVKEFVNKAIAKREKRAEIDADWIIKNLQIVANRCMEGEPVMKRDGNEWVESGEWRFDSSGANKALELLGKHFGIFTDKIRIDGELTVKSVEVNLVKGKDGKG